MDNREDGKTHEAGRESTAHAACERPKNTLRIISVIVVMDYGREREEQTGMRGGS